MTTPFIRNHQYNFLKKQAAQLQHACTSVADKRVVEAVRMGVYDAIWNLFEEVPTQEREMLAALSGLNTAGEIEAYLNALEPYLIPFPELTPKGVSKLFPKVKKLKMPDFSAWDNRFITYGGWSDTASGKMYLVYELNGHMVGIEGRFTPAKKNVCFLCNRHKEVALVSAISKVRPPKASPDYYKAVGNYMCMDSEGCNKEITDIATLENFLGAIFGDRYM